MNDIPQKAIVEFFKGAAACHLAAAVEVELVPVARKSIVDGQTITGMVAWAGRAWSILADDKLAGRDLWRTLNHELAHVLLGHVVRGAPVSLAAKKRAMAGGVVPSVIGWLKAQETPIQQERERAADAWAWKHDEWYATLKDWYPDVAAAVRVYAQTQDWLATHGYESKRG